MPSQPEFQYGNVLLLIVLNSLTNPFLNYIFSFEALIFAYHYNELVFQKQKRTTSVRRPSAESDLLNQEILSMQMN